MDAKIIFEVSPIADMVMSLMRIANKKYSQSYMKESSIFSNSSEIIEGISLMEKKLSRFYSREVEFFFTKELWFGLVIWQYIRDNKLDSFNELLEFLKKQDENILARDMLSSVFQDMSDAELDSILQSQETLDAYIQKSMYVSADEMDKIHEIFKYREDSKDRLIRLFERYYEIYAEKMKYFNERAEEAGEKFKKLCMANSEGFINEYLDIKLELVSDYPEIHMVSSYFADETIYLSADIDRKKPAYITYGCNVDKKVLRKQQQEKRKLFFKILSEEKRIEIIKKLSKRPCYIYELGKELNLTSATVSYHVNMLMEIGIVRLERDGHRFYYELMKDKLKELFDMAYEEITV